MFSKLSSFRTQVHSAARVITRSKSTEAVSKAATESHRVANFSAGPACLPLSVMEKAQAEFTNYRGCGMGFMELSHRDVDGPVQNTLTQTAANLRSLLDIPDNYHVLFHQGGAHGQFAAVPLNLAGREGSHADYAISGFWGTRAIDEAKLYTKTNVALDCADVNFKTIPDPSEWKLTEGASYVHTTANETIHGLEFLTDPDVPSDAPLVCDMTSTLLSRPVDIEKYGVIYASGGKNLGPAGVCVTIVRDDLVEREPHPNTPSVLNFSKTAGSQPIPSIYNTPPTFLVYMMHLVTEDLIQKGGMEAAEKRAIERSGKTYELFDASNGFYCNDVDPAYRSRMNVPFRLRGGDEALEAKFLKEAEAAGMHQLFGHPLFGGMRITLYNGVPDEALDKLHLFMLDFMKRNI